MNEMERPYHPAANLFPLMQGDDFKQLKADITANGLLEAIMLDADGRILDGRNRHRACIETEAEPRFTAWRGGGSAVAFVVSMNLHRRHLTSGQRAAVAVDILPELEREAKERQAHGMTAPGRTLDQKVDQASSEKRQPQTTEQAAQLLNTNRQYVSDAKKLKEGAPDLFEALKSGELKMPVAKREYVARQAKEAPTLPDDKYRVIYADPPWSYGNRRFGGTTEPADHYPVMSLADICQLPVRGIVADAAVLFLWVTSPLLQESFEVIGAWGFKYKTSFIWDKVKHNMGHYNSVRHELLLVCTRGSCQPDVRKLFDSVQSIERTEHSKKPEEFRGIIDTIYPHGKRIELFARQPVPGWEVWGNELS